MSTLALRLAAIYNESLKSAIIVARICDEALDVSGALLGEVRQASLTLSSGNSDRGAKEGFNCGRCGELVGYKIDGLTVWCDCRGH